MWVAKSLSKTMGVQVLGEEKDMDVCNVAEGCCGYLLAFETKEQAETFANGNGVFEVRRKYETDTKTEEEANHANSDG